MVEHDQKQAQTEEIISCIIDELVEKAIKKSECNGMIKINQTQ